MRLARHAAAAPITFSYTGGFQTFTTPTAGLYDILAVGAVGAVGAGGGAGAGEGAMGGLGTAVEDTFSLTAGEVLSVAVGGRGASGLGGGGYSGGFGGDGCIGPFSRSGGGGTSFDAGSSPLLTLAANAGDGAVMITPVAAPVPEPVSLALLSTALLGLGLARRRKAAG